MDKQYQAASEAALISARIQERANAHPRQQLQAKADAGLKAEMAPTFPALEIMSYGKPGFPPSPEHSHHNISDISGVHEIIGMPVFATSVAAPREPGLRAYFNQRWSVLKDGNTSLKTKIRSLPFLGYCIAWFNALLKLGVTRHHHTVEIEFLQKQIVLQQEQYQKIIAESNLQAQQIISQANAQTAQLVSRVQDLNENINRRVSALEQFTDGYIQSLHAAVDAKQHVLLANINELNARINADKERIQTLENVKTAARLHRYDTLELGSRLMKLEQLEMARKLKQFSNLLQLNQHQAIKEDAEFEEMKNRLAAIERASLGQTLPSTTNTNVAERNAPSSFDQDQFYVDFEAAFRGDKAEIKQRLHAYLPYLTPLLSETEAKRPTFIDVGCGRGEWLELLTEQGIPVIGIDLNTAMVDACLASGYAAKVADAIEFLNQQEAGSIGGVTGFHIIEHLPFQKMIALFDAAYQALAPGGMIIFETPNPENLIIGACNFYYDPTHLHPIVPDVALFIAKQRGFKKAEILRLHPFPPDYQMQGKGELDQALNKFLFSAQDYAVIAWK